MLARTYRYISLVKMAPASQLVIVSVMSKIQKLIISLAWPAWSGHNRFIALTKNLIAPSENLG